MIKTEIFYKEVIIKQKTTGERKVGVRVERMISEDREVEEGKTRSEGENG